MRRNTRPEERKIQPSTLRSLPPRHPFNRALRPPAMKFLFAAFMLLAAGLVFSGCESDVPPANDTTGAEKLRRGVTGQGAIVQPDRSEDPLIREQSRVGY